MMCVGLLSFWILYGNGQTSYHNSPVTKADRTRIESLLVEKKFRKDFDVYQVLKKKFKPFKKPRKCK